jgi:hypothetical protein
MEPFYLMNFAEFVFSIFAIGFWLLVLCTFVWAFTDVLRRRDVSGMGKAGWTLLLLVLPLIGIMVYLAARPKYADDNVAMPWAPTSNSGMSPAEELAYAQGLLTKGTITQAEFDEIKFNILQQGGKPGAT